MQLVDYSGFGLRVARHVLQAPDRPLTVTLFPMVHIGEPGFFEKIATDAGAHDVILAEGVDAPAVKRITRSYRWIALEELGLVLQPRARDMFQGRTIVHADLEGAEFQTLWFRAPMWQRAAIEIGAAVFGVGRRLFASRSSIGAQLVLDDGPDRAAALRWSPETAAMNEAIHTARDQRLLKVLGREMKGGKGAPRSIAVVYGAGHMPAVTTMLAKQGFRVTQSDWIKVFDPV